MQKLLRSSIFTICIKLAISAANGFYPNPTNLNSGINFYGEIPDTSFLRRPEVLYFRPDDCSEDCNISFFNDPDICCGASEPIECDFSYPYQNYNGSCNNPHIPSLGMSEICLLRLTPAYYEGKDGVRKSVTGVPLPEPRDISQYILIDIHRPSSKVTYLFTAFGQIIAHDISRTRQPPTRCCKPENAEKQECSMPISVRTDDPFYSKFNVTCLQFARNEQCKLCQTEHRQQKNYATAALDASIVYGVSKEEAKKLRTIDGTGKLKSSSKNKGYLLPSGKDKGDAFCPKGQDSNCFRAGDPRVNMHVSLTALQTIYMRQHNLLAETLKEYNPHWGEEKLFQEARKILIALHQCIIYRDYLPILLGSFMVDLFNLTVKSGPRGTRYDSKVVLAEFQEHSVAGFRIHSMVPTNIGLSGFQFKDTYGNPNLIREGCISSLAEGSYQVPSEEYDPWVVTDLSNYFNKKPGEAFGSDLLSIDIQRGRDHGLAPYVEMVKFCSGGTVIISSFRDLYRLSMMPRENILLLKNTYNDVRDVDMEVGMMSEYHYPGSQLGPTATCVNVIQFYSLQKGDRFYFDNEGPGAPFTPKQRSAIKQYSFARMLCDNTKMTHVTMQPFIRPYYNNPDIACKYIPKLDLSAWKEDVFEADTSTDCSV